jgi:hypothetical protein
MCTIETFFPINIAFEDSRFSIFLLLDIDAVLLTEALV